MKEKEKTKDEGDRNWEVADQGWKAGSHETVSFGFAHAVEDDVADEVESATASTTGCLPVVQSIEVDTVAGENNGLAGHIDTQCQSSF